MNFESEGLLIVAIYIWLPPASYVVFLTTLVVYIYVVFFLNRYLWTTVLQKIGTMGNSLSRLYLAPCFPSAVFPAVNSVHTSSLRTHIRKQSKK